MWLPYFCNSTNINTSTMMIHENGYAWRFIRKSLLLRSVHVFTKRDRCIHDLGRFTASAVRCRQHVGRRWIRCVSLLLERSIADMLQLCKVDNLPVCIYHNAFVRVLITVIGLDHDVDGGQCGHCIRCWFGEYGFAAETATTLIHV